MLLHLRQVIASLILIIFITAVDSGAVTKTRTYSDIYFGLHVPYGTVSGDFKGQNMFGAVDESIAIPDIDGGFGFGASIGYTRVTARDLGYTLEFSYSRMSQSYLQDAAEHFDGDAWLTTVDFTFKGILSAGRAHYYALIGLSLPWITIEDGAFAVMPEETLADNARFSGLGMKIGGGAKYYMHKRIAMFGEAYYRPTRMSSVQGIYDDYSINGGLDASGWGFRLGLLYIISMN